MDRTRFFKSKVQGPNGKILSFAILSVILIALPIYIAHGREGGTVKFLSFHAHRYQDFERGSVACEIFGEMENLGTKELRGVQVEVDLLDEKNKIVYSEDMELLPRVIVYGNPKGVERPLKSSEVGVFELNMKECPSSWLEGRIRYKFIEAITGE